ncbi:hypothetical protein JOC75_000261 [Metabacillus crassostreae]|nr:hypothetical protein [Metabacillus crassostreae]
MVSFTLRIVGYYLLAINLSVVVPLAERDTRKLHFT